MFPIYQLPGTSALGRPRFSSFRAAPLIGARRFTYLTPHRSLPYAGEIAIQGAGKIAGVITAQGAPAENSVMAMSSPGLRRVMGTRSDKTTGRWTIYPLPAQTAYLVTAVHRNGRFNAVVFDRVMPVPWDTEEE
jgi:hypothetical protein